MINGIINIYKEKGFTSHDVVAKARGILRERRIGHTGTLDPDAEGVLPICIGTATKVVPYLTDADKCYEAEVILGQTTTTEDASGEVLETHEVNVTKEQIEEIVASFVGEYVQTPPMYSAIKVNGVRLYEYARRGEIVERPSRKVFIESCDIIEFMAKDRFRIRVNCSKGTYIRTLCTDIGKALGCGAHMGYLLRTRVGHFRLEDSMKLSELEARKEAIAPYVESLEMIFKDLKAFQASEAGQKYLANGNPLKRAHLVGNHTQVKADEMIAVYDAAGAFKAVYVWQEAKKLYKVEKMF